MKDTNLPQTQTAVVEVVRRLKSQPLVFAFGVILLLVMAASTASGSLRYLLWPALAVFVIGSLIWVVAELARIRARKDSTAKKGSINVHATAVGKTGVVTGIEGMPASQAAPSSVDVSGKDIEGKVSGVSYGRSEDTKKSPRED